MYHRHDRCESKIRSGEKYGGRGTLRSLRYSAASHQKHQSTEVKAVSCHGYSGYVDSIEQTMIATSELAGQLAS